MRNEQLQLVHEDIQKCRACATFATGFAKPRKMDRGEGTQIMLVGQGPGKTELRRAAAFAGQSGKTLDSWLASATGNKRDPRQGMYLTSVIKCCHSLSRDFPLMAKNCAVFLERQIASIEPKMIITLGREAYEQLRFTPTDYNEALCTPVHSSHHLLLSQFGFHFWLLPWPHPSGLNRWLNSEENKDRLRKSFGSVRRILEAER